MVRNIGDQDMFGLPSNDTRAEWAEQAIQAFEEATNVDREDAISDLICALMHHCNINGAEFLAELNRGAGHFQAEIEIEEKQEAGEDCDPSQVAENPFHFVRVDGFAPRPADSSPEVAAPVAADPEAARMEHIEIAFGLFEDIESPTAEIARTLRKVADDFERDGIPATYIYDSHDRFVGEVKITRIEE
jgi:hypothetical protein